jgi:hypothetical protein
MAFTPASTQLNTLNELKNLSHLITYTSTLGVVGSTGYYQNYPVTITTTQPNATILVSGNTISGYYSDCFSNQIHYRTVDDNFIVVTKWSDILMAIADGVLSEVYYYQVDTTTRIVYSYLATAGNGDTQTYTINVDNDWTSGRNELIKFTNLSKYQQEILTLWINNNSNKVAWANNVLDIIDWENNAL